MFAEVFFDNVKVPVENRLGDEGQGWKVTLSSLAHERSGISEVEGLKRHLEAIKDLARQCRRNGRPALEDPTIRRRIARADTRIEAMRLNGLRFLTKQLKGEPLGSETSISKLQRADLEIELGELAVEMQGSWGPLARGAEGLPEDGRWQRYSLSWPEIVIGGGTPNIQKNIIAERILGLPKD
jgi:alkylation response protein AidB-like acyl-CoA dehydrogenase